MPMLYSLAPMIILFILGMFHGIAGMMVSHVVIIPVFADAASVVRLSTVTREMCSLY